MPPCYHPTCCPQINSRAAFLDLLFVRPLLSRAFLNQRAHARVETRAKPWKVCTPPQESQISHSFKQLWFHILTKERNATPLL